jgi:hypothetical protein
MRRRALMLMSIIVPAVGLASRGMAQDGSKPFTPQELDQMLAPIALYPDSLLSQVLMAAGYPLEIVEAARWSKANPALKGDAAVAAVKSMSWDTSVKSLVAFPDVLANLDGHLDWTQKLGDAMISQQQAVADSIQRLRAKAAAQNNLKTTPQQKVTTEGSGDNVQYIIEPANPQVIYVPAYNPSWAYGPWPYPSYPPVYYPPAGAMMSGFFWGLGFAAGAAMFSSWNWGRGNAYVNVNVNQAQNIDNTFNRNTINANGQWQHNPAHRGGVPYRDPATRARFNQATRPDAAQRDQFRGRLENSPTDRQYSGNRTPGGGQSAAGERQQADRGNERPSAWSGADRGQSVNRESERGNQQMGRAQSHPSYQPRSSWGGERGGGFHGGRR